MSTTASALARRLARDAEAVCRHYLSNGRRAGRYWLAGDIDNTPGRSLFVRLLGPDEGKGAAGKWTDAATGEHGDLLDLIAANQRLATLSDTLVEARRFLSLPQPERFEERRHKPVPVGSPEASRRLWAMAKPIGGTIAETYLRERGLTGLRTCTALRFHPHCYYRGDDEDTANHARGTWPALIAAVSDLDSMVTGVHRTWLDPSGTMKASVSTPRRVMGNLLGHGVRFGQAIDTMAVGEGIETTLSLRSVLPTLPMVAALSANHLAALILPPGLRRLYIARDDDAAGHGATAALTDRAQSAGIEVVPLVSTLGDFNDDLRQLGLSALADGVRVQLDPDDVARFWMSQRSIGGPTGAARRRA